MLLSKIPLHFASPRASEIVNSPSSCCVEVRKEQIGARDKIEGRDGGDGKGIGESEEIDQLFVQVLLYDVHHRS